MVLNNNNSERSNMSFLSFRSSKTRGTGKLVNFYLLSQKYRFSQQELYQHHERFTRISRSGVLSIEDFRESMGFLGLNSTRVIADRIFRVMDSSHMGTVSFEDFLDYMDIVIHGTRDEKAYYAFRLIAQDSPSISFEEFASWLHSIWKMYNVLTESSIVAEKEDIQRYFNSLDLKQDGVIDFDEYKESMSRNGEGLEWFDILSTRMATNFQPEEKKKKEPRRRFDTIEHGINDCIRILTDQFSTFSDSSRKEKDPLLAYDSGELKNPSDSEESMCISEPGTPIESNEETSTNVSSAYSKVIEKMQGLLEKVDKLKCEEGSEFEPRRSRMLSTQMNVPKVSTHKKKSFIQWGDQDWNLVMNMMLGIQKSVKTAEALLDSMAHPNIDDFNEIFLHKLPSQSKSLKPSKLIDIAPSIFERIRRLYKISSSIYIKSLGVENIVNSLLQSNFSSLVGLLSSGKSGSFFYYSADSVFVLKTLSKGESKFFKKILPSYYEHIMRYPDTLIPRIYGFHQIRSYIGVEKVKRYFIVMNNVFSSGHEIHLRYDLKGSIFGRRTDPLEDYSVARKDLDFNDADMKIALGINDKQKLLEQLQEDCNFFVKNEIIDYSLLLGIHYIKNEVIIASPNEAFWKKDDGGMVSTDKTTLYFCGLIDILTFYNNKKRIEHVVKGALHGKRAISCIPPQAYADRFLNYISSIIM